MDCSTPGLPVHRQLPEFTQTHVHWVGDAIQPSHPLLSSSLPAFNAWLKQGQKYLLPVVTMLTVPFSPLSHLLIRPHLSPAHPRSLFPIDCTRDVTFVSMLPVSPVCLCLCVRMQESCSVLTWVSPVWIWLYHILKWNSLSCVQLLGTPWSIASQASLSMEFSRQEYWSG